MILTDFNGAGLRVWLDGDFTGRNLFWRYPAYFDTRFSLFAGYSIYDIIVMSCVGGEPVALWIHHGVDES